MTGGGGSGGRTGTGICGAAGFNELILGRSQAIGRGRSTGREFAASIHLVT